MESRLKLLLVAGIERSNVCREPLRDLVFRANDRNDALAPVRKRPNDVTTDETGGTVNGY